MQQEELDDIEKDLAALSQEELRAKYDILKYLPQKESPAKKLISLVKENIFLIIYVFLVLTISTILWLLGKDKAANIILIGSIPFYYVLAFLIKIIFDVVDVNKTLDKGIKNSNLFEQGDALINSGKNKQAISIFRRLVEDEPKNPDYWFKLGQALQDDGQIDEALSCYENCNNFYNRQQGVSYGPSAYNNMGIIFEKKGKRKKAIECFETAASYGSPQAEENLKELLRRNK